MVSRHRNIEVVLGEVTGVDDARREVFGATGITVGGRAIALIPR